MPEPLRSPLDGEDAPNADEQPRRDEERTAVEVIRGEEEIGTMAA